MRNMLGLSQRKTAEKLGVDPATIRNCEAGRLQPTGKGMELIGDVLRLEALAKKIQARFMAS
jgi:DNA-binding XRE family transcriptional regulator